jgi:hypothetical protein
VLKPMKLLKIFTSWEKRKTDKLAVILEKSREIGRKNHIE